VGSRTLSLQPIHISKSWRTLWQSEDRLAIDPFGILTFTVIAPLTSLLWCRRKKLPKPFSCLPTLLLYTFFLFLSLLLLFQLHFLKRKVSVYNSVHVCLRINGGGTRDLNDEK
jgi:hypothetical protein